jgi:S-(hydroxymethyl)glutathione dehydrogenase / alcohol dehydrogenase
MQAAVARELGKISVEDIDRPEPALGEVLVKVAAAGVCHTDITALTGGLPVPMPIVLGHEGAGVVEAVGPGVTALVPGDHVVLSITAGCGRCSQCQRSAYSLCEVSSAQVLAGTMLDGTTRLSKGSENLHSFLFQSSFAEYAVVPAACAVKVRRDAPLAVASLLGCGASTGYGAVVRRAQVHPGATALVIGAGGVGLSVVMAARLAGAQQIIVADKSEAALKLAGEFGASDTILVAEDGAVVPEEALRLTGTGVDYAFDVVGAPGTLEQAFQALRPGGKAIAIGMADASVTVTVPLLNLIFEKQLTGTYNGSIQPHVDIPAALDAYMAGQFPLDRLVSRRYALDQIDMAINDLHAGGSGRGVIVFDGEDA